MKKTLVLLATQIHSSKSRMLLFVLTAVLFVVSAGAPNCPIGIGK